MRYIAPRRAQAVGDAQYRTLAAFRYALRRFFRFSELAAAAAGVTPRQYQALLAVRAWSGDEPVTVGDLAEQLQLRHHSAVGLVQRLQARSLLVRGALARDRRRATLTLTPRGRRLLERLAAEHRDELRRSRPQLRALLRLLDD